ncbi:nucleoside phosphatase family-domain-containing protein [Hyaloraphidium curvatum]|nr:nucleoside phosphatase family-domain-containing protein [Hyaloraphidium curvatum]
MFACPLCGVGEAHRPVFIRHNLVVLQHWGFGGRAAARRTCTLLAAVFLLLYAAGVGLALVVDPAMLPRIQRRQAAAPAVSGPDAPEPWAAHRKYGIVIDAGSSGSRLQIYSWKDTRWTLAQIEAHGTVGNLTRNSLPLVEKGDEDGEDWQKRVEPGISSFGPKPQELAAYLKPLMDHALTVIPESEVSTTPVFLYATAGMRLLPPSQRDAVLAETCRFFRTNYKFHLPDCAAHIQVISGEWEGIYGWVAINQLMGGFASGETLGFLDMGGASTQITFEPTADIRKVHANDMMQVNLRTLGGADLEYSVYTTTFLGYGMNEARRRYLGWLVDRAQKQASAISREVAGKDRASRHNSRTVAPTASTQRLQRRAEDGPSADDESAADSPSSAVAAATGHVLRKMEAAPPPGNTSSQDRLTVLDPCLPNGVVMKDREHLPSAIASLNPTLVGTGSFAQCVLTTIPLLNKTAPCPDEPCLFNGVHIPGGAPGRRPDMHFIGISEYWYTVENVFQLGGDYSYKDFANAARTFCAQDWNTTMDAFRSSKFPHVHDVEKLQFQCFKAAWLVNFLHEGLGIPQQYLADEDKDDMVPLRSVNEISGLQISWTLGVMVIYAAGTVPPAGHAGEALGRVATAAVVAVPVALIGVCLVALFIVVWQPRRRHFSPRNGAVELARRSSRPEGVSLLNADIEAGPDDSAGTFVGDEVPYSGYAGIAKPMDPYAGTIGIDRRSSPKPYHPDGPGNGHDGWTPKLGRTTSFLGRASPRPPNSPSRKGSHRQ